MYLIEFDGAYEGSAYAYPSQVGRSAGPLRRGGRKLMPIEPGQWRRPTPEMLGTQVRVKLDENVLVEGRLLTYGDSGEFTIEDDSGFVHHCWALLDIVATSGQPATSGDRPIGPDVTQRG